MPDNAANLFTAAGNFGILVLTALGIKGRIDTLAKAVVYKETCKVCGSGMAHELALLRKSQEEQHKEQMELIKTVYRNLPKRAGD